MSPTKLNIYRRCGVRLKLNEVQTGAYVCIDCLCKDIDIVMNKLLEEGYGLSPKDIEEKSNG